MNFQDTKLTPNVADMKEHLSFLFTDAHEYDDGFIEIAYGHPAPNKARLFSTGSIDAVVALATEQSLAGKNIYVGAALRDPDTLMDERAKDGDYYATTAAYADLDDAAAVQAARARTAALKPGFTVCTGQHPHRRVQLWWRLVEPITDPRQHRSIMRGLVESLSGDPNVTNPSRIMRLAGSIAWPTKPGRVPEMTFVTTPDGGAGDPCTVEALEREYPTASKHDHVNTGGDWRAKRHTKKSGLGLDTGIIDDGREEYMRDTIMAVFIELVGTTGAIPTARELFDAAWPQYERKADLSRPGRGRDEFERKCAYIIRRFEEGKLSVGATLDDIVAAYDAKQRKQQQKSGKGW